MTKQYVLDRQKRSFQEHMKTLYQNIDTLIYSAEITCGVQKDYGSICKHKEHDCPFKSKMFPTGSLYICKLHSIRALLGEHFEQSDIKELEVTKWMLSRLN